MSELQNIVDTETKRFRPVYRQLSDDEKAKSDELKTAATSLAVSIQSVKAGAPSREKSLAITKLEESVMWAIKALTACAIVALFVGSPTPTLADDQVCQGIGACNQQDNDPITNTNTNSAAAAATGGNATGGTAVNTTVLAVDVDADNLTRIYNAPKNTNVNVNRTNVDTRDYNHVSNRQDQKQGQIQGQDQYQGQHQKIDDSGNSSIVWNEKRDVAQAYAGSATIANDSCGSSVGAGGQGPAFGFSFNFARDDEVCEIIKLSRRVQELGYADGAIKLMCQDDRVAEALPQICAKPE